MKAGDKKTAEHHGLQARIAGWRENMTSPAAGAPKDSELQLARPTPPPAKAPLPPRDMPWKKKPPAGGQTPQPKPSSDSSES
jgi:hypothetical protein